MQLRTKHHAPRTVSFKTVGCRLNQAETARMSAQFISAGYEIVSDPGIADVIVIHSCAITGNAERKSVQHARSAKKSNPSTFIVIAGCAVEVNKDDLQVKSGADLLVGQKDKFRLPELIPHPHTPILPYSHTIPPYFHTTRALIKVQDGCDFRCAYCVVPDARGLPVSRSFTEIIDEALKLADSGYKEVVLTGANLGCYQDGEKTLIDLLSGIEDIAAIERTRLSSIEISTIEREIIDYMAESKKMCRYMHIPLQTGDDSLLSSMGRRYRVADYRDLLEYAVSHIPLLGIGTDIMAGLPGETEEAFNNTVNFVSDLPFSNLHVFPYSKREGTPAASMQDQVPDSIKKERCRTLAELGRSKKEAFAKSLTGNEVSVLIEHVDGKQAGGWTGEYIEALISRDGIECNQVVRFTPEEYDGKHLI